MTKYVFMVTIYALFHPLTNDPFYVGSTSQKLSSRLGGHLNNMEGVKEKQAILLMAKQQKLKIEIVPLLVCPEKVAVKCETYIYHLLIKNGYTLHQQERRLHRKKIKP